MHHCRTALTAGEKSKRTLRMDLDTADGFGQCGWIWTLRTDLDTANNADRFGHCEHCGCIWTDLDTADTSTLTLTQTLTLTLTQTSTQTSTQLAPHHITPFQISEYKMGDIIGIQRGVNLWSLVNMRV